LSIQQRSELAAGMAIASKSHRSVIEIASHRTFFPKKIETHKIETHKKIASVIASQN